MDNENNKLHEDLMEVIYQAEKPDLTLTAEEKKEEEEDEDKASYVLSEFSKDSVSDRLAEALESPSLKLSEAIEEDCIKVLQRLMQSRDPCIYDPLLSTELHAIGLAKMPRIIAEMEEEHFNKGFYKPNVNPISLEDKTITMWEKFKNLEGSLWHLYARQRLFESIISKSEKARDLALAAADSLKDELIAQKSFNSSLKTKLAAATKALRNTNKQIGRLASAINTAGDVEEKVKILQLAAKHFEEHKDGSISLSKMTKRKNEMQVLHIKEKKQKKE